MKLKDVMRISTRSIKAHPGRNIMIVAVMGIIFGLILTINLLFQGIENTYSKLANQAMDGKVIIEATNSIEGMVTVDASPKVSRREMMEDIKKYGGELLGDMERFGLFGSVVLPKELVENGIETNLEKAPTDAAPVLVSTFLGEQLLGKRFSTKYTDAIRKQKDYETYRDEIIGKVFTDQSGAKYYVVGLSPGNFHVSDLSFRQLERRNNSLLNPILSLIPTPDGAPIVIDNGRSDSWQGGENINPGEATDIKAKSDSLIVIFNDNKSAYNYFQHGKGKFMNVDLPNRTYSVNVVAGMSPETQYIFNGINLIASIVSIALGLIAIIVTIFTSIRLVDQDQSNIALYHSLGATAKQVRGIYQCYFLWLMIGAAIFAFGLASLVVLAFSLANQEILGIQAMLGFGLEVAPPVMWYGPSSTIGIVMVIMLLAAPLCVLINYKKLARSA